MKAALWSYRVILLFAFLFALAGAGLQAYVAYVFEEFRPLILGAAFLCWAFVPLGNLLHTFEKEDQARDSQP